MRLDRTAMGLLAGVVFLGCSSLVLFTQNTRLRAEVATLKADVRVSQAQRPRGARAQQASRGNRLGPVRGQARGKAPLARAKAPATRGQAQAHPQRPAAAQRPTPEAREKMTEQNLARMLEAAASVGAREGWSPSQIDQVSAILEDSFAATDEVREMVRSRAIDAVQAKEKMAAIKGAANEELVALLGEEGNKALRLGMRDAKGAEAP